MEHNFDKMWANTARLPYDYTSVMHYRANAFSINGQPTIIPRQQGARIGQRQGLSSTDWQHLEVYCEYVKRYFG